MSQSESDQNAFVVTYPCYFPLSADGERLITVIVDGLPAVVFLTDKDLANRFCKEWSSGNRGKGFKLLPCEDRAALLETLRRVETRTRNAGIQHVAIDPGGRYKCAYVAIRELFEYIEALPVERTQPSG